VDSRRQGVRRRCCSRGGLARYPGARRDGLHRGDRRRPASARRQNSLDLRRHQRDSGDRSGDAQAPPLGRRDGAPANRGDAPNRRKTGAGRLPEFAGGGAADWQSRRQSRAGDAIHARRCCRQRHRGGACRCDSLFAAVCDRAGRRAVGRLRAGGASRGERRRQRARQCRTRAARAVLRRQHRAMRVRTRGRGGWWRRVTQGCASNVGRLRPTMSLSARAEGGKTMSGKHWLAAYGAKIPCEIDPDAHGSVLAMLEAAMQRFADRPAFRCFGHTLSYADTDRLSRNFAAFLQHKLGVKKGDRIAVMLPNIAAFPIAMLGIIRAGGVQVNVNPLYTPRELEHQLNDAGVETIVIFNGASVTLAEIIGKTAVKQVISVGPGEGIGAALPAPPADPPLKSVITLADALAQGAELPFLPVALCGDDLLFLQYTGGTTGLSKGAALSHRNLVANTEQFKAFMGDAMRPGEDVVVTALPLYHIFALMVNFISYYSMGAENWLIANPRDMDGFVE